MRTVRIAGTGMYTPIRSMPTEEVGAMLKLDLTQQIQTGGVRVKKIMADDEEASDLAVYAGMQALKNAGVKPSELDLIIVSTDTPDYISPCTASIVQHRLLAKNAGIFDTNCACAGWVTALNTATKYIMADQHFHKALVIGTYAMTRFLNWQDKVTAPTFSDGAGAAVLVEDESETGGYLGSMLYADGYYWDYLGVYLGSARLPTAESVANQEHKVQYNQNKRFPDVNSEHWPRLVRETLAQAKLTPQDADMLLFTQVRRNTIEGVMNTLGLPMTKTHTVMEKFGYTGSACVPMALHDALEQDLIHGGDIVVMTASGGGYAMACYTMRWL
jgi:3-oxoacyl-[acyl-carrier-protein] synthase III